jgi:hypothetical protein
MLRAQATNTFPSSGNVGIGTTTPQSPLQVDATSDTPTGGINANGSIDNVTLSLTTTGAGGTTWWIDSTAGTSGYGQGKLVFGSGGWTAPVMTLLSTGWVGIGTANPVTSFEVHAATNEDLYVSPSQNLSSGVTVFSTNDANSAVQPLEFGASQFYFAGGYVGIGTTSPQQLLDVAGTMAAREVIVSTTGADYVFDTDYHLAPLTEVVSYINDHHHLPDIPSAAEMTEKGVGVADMQAKLLAKIEELTLYVIEEHETNKRLAEQNKDLQEQNHLIREQIAALEARIPQ